MPLSRQVGCHISPSKSQIVPVPCDLFQTQGQILPELNQKPGKTTTEPPRVPPYWTQEAKLVFSSLGNTPEWFRVSCSSEGNHMEVSPALLWEGRKPESRWDTRAPGYNSHREQAASAPCSFIEDTFVNLLVALKQWSCQSHSFARQSSEAKSGPSGELHYANCTIPNHTCLDFSTIRAVG